VNVTSEYLFRATDNEQLHWRLGSLCETQEEGKQDLEIAAQGAKAIVIDADVDLIAEGEEELLLDLWITARDETPTLPRGHELARSQHVLAVATANTGRKTAPAEIIEQGDHFVVTTGGSVWRLNTSTGFISNWET